MSANGVVRTPISGGYLTRTKGGAIWMGPLSSWSGGASGSLAVGSTTALLSAASPTVKAMGSLQVPVGGICGREVLMR